MKFSEEQITEFGIDADQAAKIGAATDGHEAELKQGWDNKANIDAQAIIDGAAQQVETLTGIKREQGVKIADYLGMAGTNYLKGQKADLTRKEKELDDKIKAGGGDETLKTELETTKSKLDVLKQKEAEFDSIVGAGYKEKYEDASQKLSGQTLDIAFGKVKPAFPDTVNAYEAKGRWNEFKQDILTKYDVKLGEDGEPIAIAKDNEYKIVKLEALVKENEQLSELSKGRQLKGIGGPAKGVKVKDVPFEIPENATPKQRQEAIQNHLIGPNGKYKSKLDDGYSKDFAELNARILKGDKE